MNAKAASWMRFFGGLSVDETAQVLDVSVETVMRDWKLAKAWLFRELSQGETQMRERIRLIWR